jgi:PAS domain S-box-containing protein
METDAMPRQPSVISSRCLDDLCNGASAADIKERTWAAEEFRQVFDLAPGAMLIADRRARIVLVNVQTEQLFGYDRQELLGQPVEMLMPDRFRERHREHVFGYFTNPLARQIDLALEVYGLRKDGSQFPAQISLSPVQTADGVMVSSAIRDVSDWKRSEQQIAHLSSIPEQNPNPIIEIDFAGNLIYLNAEARSRFPDLPARGLEHPFLQGVTSFIAAFQKGEADTCVREVDLGHAVYEQKVTRVFLSNLVRIFSSDVTGRKRHQQELDRYAARLERFNRELARSNRELQDFAYVVSHDLRAPLVNIQGFGQELSLACERLRSILTKMQLPEDCRRELANLIAEDIPESLEFIMTSSAKMDLLIAGVLKLSRVGRATLNISQLDMNAMLSDIVTSMQFAVDEAGASVELDRLPPCHGDKAQVTQVFTNLLQNALKYLDPQRPGIIRVCGQEGATETVYSIEDNGIGIAQEHQDAIYKIFHRLDPRHGEGEGLGLTVVRRVLDRHNGNIWVESEVNKGSKFYISLPKR